MSYQSFEGAPGDSDSQGKLKAIMLPDVRNKSVLDLGCSEGFFCGAAIAMGASRVKGVDIREDALAAAKQRFPKVEFTLGDWAEVRIEERFDLVLLLSALHYAPNQEAFIHRMMSMLSEDGVLVLELGIAPGTAPTWVSVDRSIDVREFPTMPKIREILFPYNYRLVGKSVNQIGDPIDRYVFHVRAHRKTILAVLGDSSIGKSGLARLLQAQSSHGISALSLDDLVLALHRGIRTPEVETASASQNSGIDSLEDLSKVYDLICQRDNLPELARMVIERIGKSGATVVEGGVPPGYRNRLLAELHQSGNVDVWTLQPMQLEPLQFSPMTTAWELPVATEIVGHIDEIRVNAETLTIIGWGFDKLMSTPIDSLHIAHDGQVLECAQLSRRRRPDAQAAISAQSDLIGFAAELPMQGNESEQLLHRLSAKRAQVRFMASNRRSEDIIISATAIQSHPL